MHYSDYYCTWFVAHCVYYVVKALWEVYEILQFKYKLVIVVDKANRNVLPSFFNQKNYLDFLLGILMNDKKWSRID